MTQKTNIIPLQQAHLPKSFWDAWEKMDDRAKVATYMGTLAEQQKQIDDLDKRMKEFERAVEGLEDL